MTGVLEAGAAGELILGRKKKEELAGILRLYTWIVTPRIYLYELTELLLSYNRWLELTRKELARIIESASGLFDEYAEEDEILPEALALAGEYDISLSGAFYCAAAKVRNGVLISLDPEMRRAARQAGISTVEGLS